MFSRTLTASILALFIFNTATANENNASTENYPSRAISLIVPYPAGGPNDTIARSIAPELSEILNVPVVIENKPGAAGNIGTSYIANSKADGYTIGLPGSAISINTVLFDNIPYKLSDFSAIGLVAKGPIVAVAHPSLNAKSINDVIDYAKKSPGTIAFPSGGIGTSPHLAGELLKNKANIDLLHVPYKGTGEFIPDLLAGRVPFAFVSPLIVKQHIDNGSLVALATTGSERLRGWEHLPTVSEAGIQDFEVSPWYVVVAPAGTENKKIIKLNQALKKVLESEKIQHKLASLGLDVIPGSPEKADELIIEEAKKWTSIN